MSDSTRYLLASAGIPATDADIAAIEATGRAYEVCHVLAFYAQEERAKKAKQALNEARVSRRMYAVSGRNRPDNKRR